MELTIAINAGKAGIKMPQRFDMTTQNAFRLAYIKAMEDVTVKIIEVDLAEVEFIDSCALGGLLLFRERMANSERKITLINCQPLVMKIMKTVNFNRLFDIKVS